MAGGAASLEVMSELVLFDTSILIEQIRRNRYLDRVLGLAGLVRNSSVVLAELWSGASSTVDIEFLEALGNIFPVLTPTEADWLESGQLLTMIGSG
jgi:predicted nucleic acid-binding protein